MSKRITRSVAEMELMQQRIDRGILLAQERLAKRAIHDGISLVVFRGGRVIDLAPDQLSAK